MNQTKLHSMQKVKHYQCKHTPIACQNKPQGTNFEDARIICLIMVSSKKANYNFENSLGPDQVQLGELNDLQSLT